MKVVGTLMALESWNFILLRDIYTKPLSSPPPPKPSDLNLNAVANGFPPYDRQYHKAFKKGR